MSRKSQIKYKKAPQAPRRFKSAYMFFSTEKHRSIRQELTKKEESEKLSTTEVAKMVSQAWKDLSGSEREKWEEMARKDKARYEMEKTMYTGPWKIPAKKRSQKDPNAPKRPMSAFLSFSNSKRSHVKNKHPTMGNAEVSRILAQMWKDAPDEERKEHIDKEFKLRQEYKVAIAKWRKSAETEMQAARKEREDQAMKAVLEGKPPEPIRSYLDSVQKDGPEHYPKDYPNYPVSQIVGSMHAYTGAPPVNQPPYYAPSPHYGHGAYNGGSFGSQMMDPGGRFMYADKIRQEYDGYAQQYPGNSYPQDSIYYDADSAQSYGSYSRSNPCPPYPYNQSCYPGSHTHPGTTVEPPGQPSTYQYGYSNT